MVLVDTAVADFVIRFLECLTFTRGKWAGQPFRLLPWQLDAVREFYGTVTTSHLRVYQYLYLEIPKKNGKSELAAGLGLYHLIADGEKQGEVYLVAADRDNAGIIYRAALTMVNNSKALKKRIKVKESTKEMIDRPSGTILKVLSSEAYSKHGYSPSCVIFDELHAQSNRDLWDVMTYGAGAAREQPVWIVLTTAGDDPDRNSIGWEVHEKAKTILRYRSGDTEGTYDDSAWLPIIYGLPDDPEEVKSVDIWDEAVWYRCNPSLGYSLSVEKIRQEALDAQHSPARERLFRWLRLNQWIAVKSSGWLPLTLFDATTADLPDLAGKTCYGGLDLSSTTDLSAFVLVFPPQEGLEFWAIVFFDAWITSEAIRKRERRDHVPFELWARQGFVSMSDGDTINFADIEQAVRRASRQYNLKVLGVDPYLSRMLTQNLMDTGQNIVEIPQTMMSMSPPMKQTERLLREGMLLHAAHPCARWCFGNVRCATDGNENIKPMKNKSIDRIDLIVALIIAMATAMLDTEPDINERITSDDWSL